MKLYVARHGKTPWNEQGRVCGKTDVPLTDKGREQAHSMAEKTIGCGINRIIASPLQRALQTAQIVSEVCGAAVFTDPRLIEQDYGTFEGQLWSPAFQENKSHFAKCYPGGESHMKVAARTYALLDELKTEGGAPTLLVCHGGVCRVMRTYFEDMTNEEFTSYAMQNCGVLEYEL